MANQSKLKAWLRYDGTGRVVTAGPIFSKNKPKDGNWRQMNADLCCGGSNPSSSTSSTTTHTTTHTTTQYSPSVYQYSIYTSNNSSTVCNLTDGRYVTVYSAASSLTSNSVIFANPNLTGNPNLDSYVFVPGTSVVYYQFGYPSGTILAFAFNCPTTTTTTTVSTPSFSYLVSDITNPTNGCILIGQTTFRTLNAFESDINYITVLYDSPYSGVFVPFVGNGEKYLIAISAGGPNPPTDYTSAIINSNGVVSNKSIC